MSNTQSPGFLACIKFAGEFPLSSVEHDVLQRAAVRVWDAERNSEIEVTPEMIEAGETAWLSKVSDMSSPSPTEFYEGGPAEACFRAMMHVYRNGVR